MKKEKEVQKEYKVPVADKNYRMSKPLKSALALGRFNGAHDRGAWKKFAIAAEVHAKTVERAVYDQIVGKARLKELQEY